MNASTLCRGALSCTCAAAFLFYAAFSLYAGQVRVRAGAPGGQKQRILNRTDPQAFSLRVLSMSGQKGAGRSREGDDSRSWPLAFVGKGQKLAS